MHFYTFVYTSEAKFGKTQCKTNLFILEKSYCGYRFKYNCLLVGPEAIGDMPSVEGLCKNPNPYLRQFRR